MRTANFRRVFGMPALLAIASAIGLLSALLGDGVWDWLSWLALGAPVAVIAWHVARPAAS
jgi:hypothetical protein